MDDLNSDLQALFTVFQAEDVPGVTSEELVRKISSAISRLTESPHSAGSKDADSTCLCLTLIGKIIAGAFSERLPQDVRMLYEDVTKRLFGPADLMLELVPLLNSQDRLLSHLTAKCVSSFVVYDLCTHGNINHVWMSTCAETFQRSVPDCMLDTCLWSLTEVIKGVLRGDCANKQETLQKLIASFETALGSLYSKLLIQDKSEQTQAAKNDVDTIFSTFMDLLEALAAVRLRSGVCSSVQRLMFLHTSALLHLMDSRLKYFVKKRVLLLLKRTVVQRPGEDWTLGGQSVIQGDELWAGDMLALADSVLQEVAAGWLRQVCVKPQPSFFGGNRETFPANEGKDMVVLRATSLILIKSLETKTKHAGTEGADHVVNVQQYMLELLTFLQEHVGQFKGETHRCSWILLVFGEQDDDMMESAKALTTLYLYQRSLSSLAPEACSWGFNPHCHFILLLQSLSFDHTVLLDFLISAETCFLEYCVLYLKLLRDNWQDFCNSCSCIEDSVRVRTTQALPSAPNTPSEGTSGTSHPQIAPQSRTSEKDSTVCSLPRLVDYGSSEESEEEVGSVSDLQTKRSDEELADTCSRTVVDLEEKVKIDFSNSVASKVMMCLTELRTVITKLHSRGLFPYNPTSLLKLLMAIEAKCHS
ncbi:protein Lines homolog 1 [Pygocentrus nattereri]|uniref:Lines homolog 1 n=1 Tax=Pygocentrus nattereri TaxID=42514 RepID=A0A3B4C6G7_PYGNA|nr:protein Lines homolog 1 [Pygocentrus nattereri]